MKINYERTVPINPRLHEVRPGDLFRPTNSERVFMRTGSRSCDEFTSDKETPLRKMFEDLQSVYEHQEDIDYDDLLFCVDIESGKLALLHSELKVEKLIGELMIKER